MQPNRTIAAQTALVVNNAASDLDLPPQSLNYQLLAPPLGAAIDANGVITWTPSAAQAFTTNLITTIATDGGTPPLSATNAFIVTVLNAITPPAITSQPVSLTNNIAANVSFSVTATGTSPVYQWFKNGTTALSDGANISGSTTPTLSLANIGLSDAAGYSVVVSNAAGSVTSSTATLTVINTNVSLFSDSFTRGTDPARWRRGWYKRAPGLSPAACSRAGLTRRNVTIRFTLPIAGPITRCRPGFAFVHVWLWRRAGSSRESRNRRSLRRVGLP